MLFRKRKKIPFLSQPLSMIIFSQRSTVHVKLDVKEFYIIFTIYTIVKKTKWFIDVFSYHLMASSLEYP
jgi:hypothetical protein